MKKIFGIFMMLWCINLMHSQTQIIAHRGFWKTENCVENSISALKNAQKIGVYGSEFDVRMTKDDKLIINHNADFKGILISETLFKDLKNLKLDNGERLPTLKDFLKQGKKNNKVKLIIELKPDTSNERETKLVENAVAEVNKMEMMPQVEFISFSLHICKELKRIAPKSIVQYLNGDMAPMELKKLNIDGFDYNYKVLLKNPQWISEAKSLNLISNSWTVNKKSTFEELQALGIQFITTDIPNSLKKIKNDL